LAKTQVGVNPWGLYKFRLLSEIRKWVVKTFSNCNQYVTVGGTLNFAHIVHDARKNFIPGKTH
jgi:hypothetical protein